MKTISIATERKRQVLDITEEVEAAAREALGNTAGIITVFVSHTTAALTTADLDPGTDLDYLDAFDAMVPKLAFRHPHDPSHMPDHILATLIGPSVSVPYDGNGLSLGTWQRVVLLEFDGPRTRSCVVHATI